MQQQKPGGETVLSNHQRKCVFVFFSALLRSLFLSHTRINNNRKKGAAETKRKEKKKRSDNEH